MVVVIVKRPKAIFMDLAGTAIKTSFIDKELMPYIKNNVKTFIVVNWLEKDIRRDVDSLRIEALKDSKAPKIEPQEAPEGEQKQSVVDYINYCSDNKKENLAISKFRFHMWFNGYDRNKLQTSVYSDVGIQLRKWKDMDIKIFVVSNTWVEAAKKFLSKTTQGNLNELMEGHFDCGEGPFNKKETFQKIVEKIDLKEEDVLFMTKSPKEAVAAKEAGLDIVLVLTHRKNVDKLTEEEKKLPRIRSFIELEFRI